MLSATGIPRQRWIRIIPIAFIMYTLSFMDRINISFAIPGIEKDLGVSSVVAGLASGIFFLGYMLLQVPGGHWATVWSARKFITIAMISWSIFAILSGLVQNVVELYLVRFLLGIAEGGVWPATLVLLSRWFPPQERARANSYYMFCIPVAAVVMAPLSGWILTWADWRTLLILEGILPLIWVAVWWMFIADKPDDAVWLSVPERVYLVASFADDQQLPSVQRGHWKDALFNRSVWWLLCAHFLALTGSYGLSLWLPEMITMLTRQSSALVGILAALPSLAGMLGLMINARHSDQTGERHKHVALPPVLGSMVLLLSAFIGVRSSVVSLALLVLALGILQSSGGIFWTLPSLFLKKEAVGPGVGFINALANLGGIMGPCIIGYSISMTQSSTTGVYILCGALGAAGIMLLLFRYPQSEPQKEAVLVSDRTASGQ